MSPIHYTPVGGGYAAVQRDPTDEVSRWGMIAMAAQLFDQNPEQVPFYEVLIDNLRTTAASRSEEADEFITVKDALDAMPSASFDEGDAEYVPGADQYFTGVVLWDNDNPDKLLGPRALRHLENLHRNYSGCWNP